MAGTTGRSMVVFTSAGKRVLFYGGGGVSSADMEGRLSTLTGMATAVMGLAQQEPFRERIRCARFSGSNVCLVVLQRHELVFVATGRGCEAYLARELEYFHEAVVMALTTRVHKLLATSPGYDVGELLGSTGSVMESIAKKAETSGEWLCGAVKAVRLDPLARANVGHVLLSARKIAKQLGGNVVFAFLFCGDKLVQCLCPPSTQERSLRATDVLLLSNFVSSQRQSLVAAESSWLPICLPRFESRGYLHAYVSYVDESIDLSLVLVAADDASGTVGAFRDVSNSVKDALDRDGVLSALRDVTKVDATAFAANRIAAETNGCEHFLFSRRRALKHSSFATLAGGAGLGANPAQTNNNSPAAATRPQNGLSSPSNDKGDKGNPTEDTSSPSHQSNNNRRRSLGRSTSKLLAEGPDVFPPAKPEDAIAQCLATDVVVSNEDHDNKDLKKKDQTTRQRVPDRTWLAYRGLALRLRSNTTQPHATLPSSLDASAHDIFETTLANALLYEVDGPTTYVSLTGPNFELFATFLTFAPITKLAEETRRLLAKLYREEAHFFFDPIFVNAY